MFDRILCPTDGSPRAAPASAHALGIARRFDATLHLVHVLDTSLIDVRALPQAYREAVTEPGDRAMDAIADVAGQLGIPIRRAVLQGRPARAVASYAADHDIDLVTIGRRGLNAMERIPIGHVTENVVTRAPIPVLTVPGAASLSVDLVKRCAYGKLLLATDGSDDVRTITGLAIELAERYESRLHVLNVVDERLYPSSYPRGEEIESAVDEQLRRRGERAIAEVIARLEDRDIAVTERIEVGLPSRTIVEYAERNGIDLIAMGITGRGGLGRQMVGSVTDRVIRQANMPVLTARSTDD